MSFIASGHKYIAASFDTPTPHEAAAAFRNAHGFLPEAVEDPSLPGVWDVIGACEGCGTPVLDNDTYASDGEGVVLCGACTDPVPPGAA